MLREIFAIAFAILPGVAPVLTPAMATNAVVRQKPRESSAAQKSSPEPTPQESAEDVVKITSKLVQVDLVVTDKNGEQVTDLKAEDFDVFEDGRRQPITHFSYIFNGPTSPASNNTTDTQAPAGRVPAVLPHRESVRRTIAIVVDDLGMSFETTASTRSALRKFVNEQVQPGDLVAIIRTGGGIGALQQFTNNKQQLLAGVERLRWNSCSRRRLNAMEPISNDNLTTSIPFCALDSWLASVQALRGIVGALRDLPGRKSLVLFSDSFPIEQQDEMSSGESLGAGSTPSGVNLGGPSRNIESPFLSAKAGEPTTGVGAMHKIAELAIRSSVVVYAVDTRGLQSLLPRANDVVGGSSAVLTLALDLRNKDIRDGRSGGDLLADQTGGLVIQNTNDFAAGLSRIMEDQKGYYLIGYRPGGETFNRHFHKITARVRTRSGLTVRTRTGFYGVTQEDSQPAPDTAVDRFQRALASPFAASDISVRLTPIFTQLAGVGPVLRSSLHISGRGLVFNEEPDGWRSAQLVLRGLLYGDNGQIVDEHRRAFTVRVRGATFERIQSQGFDYVFNMPAKKPGAYQFRIAILDTSSSRVGSAGQYLDIPDLKQKRLALSGIVLNSATVAGAAAARSTPQSVVDASEGPQRPQEIEANSGAHRFRRDTSLNYDYLVFHATGEPAGSQLTALVRLYRDGKLVFQHESPAEIMQQLEASEVLVGGRLKLGTDLALGEYVLEITVTDPLAKKGEAKATQLADFEIVE